MALFDNIKKLFQKKPSKVVDTTVFHIISLEEIKKKYEADDVNGAAKDLKMLLERYGKRKNRNHKFKGREFVDFVLGSKHKDLKNVGYTHWQNIGQIIEANHSKVYPYYKQKLKDAIDFYSKEIRDLNTITFVI